MRYIYTSVLFGAAVMAVSHLNDPFAKPYYNIKYLDSTITENDAEAQRTQLDDKYTHRIFRNSKDIYMCSIPKIDVKQHDTSLEERRRIAQAEMVASSQVIKRGWEILEGLRDTCLYWQQGWWTYKFCYADGITQFHALPPTVGVPLLPPREDPNVDIYSLGTRPKEPSGHEGLHGSIDGMSFSTTGISNSLVMIFDHGTYCPVSGAQRKTEVQFRCSSISPDRIALIKETSSCQYLMVIHTPRLCHDVAFREIEEESSKPILCTAISDENPMRMVENSRESIESDTGSPVIDDKQVSNTDNQKNDQALAHLYFDGTLPEMEDILASSKEPEGKKTVLRGGQRPPDVSAESPTDASAVMARKMQTALEMAQDIADQLEEGTLKIGDQTLYDKKDANLEFDVELQDVDGEPLGNVVMKVIDGEIRIELEEDLADYHEKAQKKTEEDLAQQNKNAQASMPPEVQAGFDRFVGRVEL